MSRPFSAYAVLELEPGADRAAVEAAYRRLIKLHHPDRAGGDGGRAADINRAYFELRSLPAPAPRSEPNRRTRRSHPKRRSGSYRPALWLLLALAVAAAVLMQADLMKQLPRWGREVAIASIPPLARPSAAMRSGLDAEVDGPTVASSIDDAVRLARSGDDRALAEKSRDCHRQLRADPNLAQLDRCAGFDYAVVALEDRDPSRDYGPFNASSVTARQMTAASLLSNDYLAIERRLNRIRSQVDVALSPRMALEPVEIEEPQNVAVEIEP